MNVLILVAALIVRRVTLCFSCYDVDTKHRLLDFFELYRQHYPFDLHLTLVTAFTPQELAIAAPAPESSPGSCENGWKAGHSR